MYDFIEDSLHVVSLLEGWQGPDHIVSGERNKVPLQFAEHLTTTAVVP